MNLLFELFGEGEDLSSLQMSVRAFLIFFITLFLLRISGTRTHGKNSAFDIVISITLGGILSRAVVGASPFIPAICSSLVLVGAHRAIAWMSLHVKGMGKIVKGDEALLFKDGKFVDDELKKNLLTDGDLMESLRLTANTESFDAIDKIIMERSGKLSVVFKEPVKSRGLRN